MARPGPGGSAGHRSRPAGQAAAGWPAACIWTRLVSCGVKLQGEYIHGRDESTARGLPSVPSDGYYVSANYRFGAWRPGVRW